MDPWEGRKKFLFWKTNLNEPKQKPDFFFRKPTDPVATDWGISIEAIWLFTGRQMLKLSHFVPCNVGAAIYRRFHPVGEIQFEGLKRPNKNDSTRLDTDYKSEEDNFIHPWSA